MFISRQNINADAKHMGSGLAATIFPTVQLQVLSLKIWTIPNVKQYTFITVIRKTASTAEFPAKYYQLKVPLWLTFVLLWLQIKHVP